MSITKLDAAYRAQTRQLRDSAQRFAVNSWNSLGSWRDADFERFVNGVVPRIEAGQQRMSILTDSYIRQAARNDFGTIRTGAAFEATTEALRGISSAELYRRPFVEMYTALNEGKPVAMALSMGADRMHDLVVTGMQLSRTHSARETFLRTPYTGFQRVPRGAQSCALCLIASTQRYRTDDLLPIHPGCVPGDSVISPVAGGSSHLADFAWSEIEAVSRRFFEGELVEFVTASGNEVRVTPNHPVLTDKGWVPAHLLSEGSAVFRSSVSHGVVGSGPDVDERPAFAEDVFDAARVAFPLVRVPLAAEDFHADGAEGEVEIVYTNGNFPTPGYSEVAERIGESGFVHTHGGRVLLDGGSALSSLVPGGFSPASGFMGGSGLGGDLFRGHLGGAESLSLGAVSDVHPVLFQNSPDWVAADFELLCNSQLGESLVGVEIDDFIGGQLGVGVDADARFNAPAGEFSPESAEVYASRGRALRERLAGDVEFDRVIKLRRVSFSGHVFNLHTREGWYSANNHIVSNCQCLVKGLHGDPDQLVINQDLLDRVHDEVAAHMGRSEHAASDLGLGKTDARGRDLSDYTDLLITRDHSEIGPVLSWREHRFTSANDIAALAN